MVVSHAEELLVAGGVVRTVERVLLPRVVLHLQHHRLHVIVQGGETLIGFQLLFAECLYLRLQRGACFVLEEVVEGRLQLRSVLDEVVEGRLSASCCLDVLLRQFHLLEVPFAGGGVGVPQHDVMPLGGCVVQASVVAGGGDGPAVVPFVVYRFDVEDDFRGSLAEEGAHRGLTLNVFLRHDVHDCPT